MSMTKQLRSDLHQALTARYSDAPANNDADPESALLRSMAGRGSCRSFLDRPIPVSWLEMLCAISLASPTKSDLQQRDIILLRSPELRRRLAELVPGQAWVAQAPMIAVFCGNNRRQRLLHMKHNVQFSNDHLDAFFNATGDAAIALGAFVTAAEAIGLGCCPISAVRNEAEAVSDMLALPDHVFPFAGLALGFPETAPTISKRLPLGVTCHIDRYQDEDFSSELVEYDAQRALAQPYERQRNPDIFGLSQHYSWSEDKARQYSQPERPDFGRFIRSKGFNLD